ncbi:hypothetical protein FJB87_20575 [Salmonella enterica subsp. enterica]|nr:hypothetical protein [Salmonella enterica subsp. enterica serovar Brandenburg]EBG6822372.1 hypothetical protein [Salmonella enterica subsp. enterica]EBY2673353.1 hypothetical protein [Salmonella enterica subsp. enterica serovar Schwarzengrund]EGP2908470.1 hypothetical protein [Salmonella enterica subsp. enterica serovar Muenster]EMC1194092.1 hypothetical protein [Salmonella enterica]
MDQLWILLLDRRTVYVDNPLPGKQLILSIAPSQNRHRGVVAYLNDIAIALPRQFAGYARSLDCGERCWTYP